MDEDGKAVDQLMEKSSIITNHHLYYLAYSAFTSMKHGYQEEGAYSTALMWYQTYFPDEGNNHVGFKYADDDDN